MALNSIQPNMSGPFAGLGTVTCNVVTAGQYVASFSSTLPLGSGLEVVINQNGSPIVTYGGASTNPTPTQISLGGSCKLQCSAGDAITWVLTSSNQVDNQALGGPSTIINFYQGF